MIEIISSTSHGMGRQPLENSVTALLGYLRSVVRKTSLLFTFPEQPSISCYTVALIKASR